MIEDRKLIHSYRLHDGTIGTEEQAVVECIATWEKRKQEAEDKLIALRTRLETASRK